MIQPAKIPPHSTQLSDKTTTELHDVTIESTTPKSITINPSATDTTKLILSDTKYEWHAPPDANTHVYTPHIGENSQYLRDFILGVNDGLVSVLLVVIGLYGGGASHTVILLSAISACLAGTIGMGTGEYIATKSQAEVTQNDLLLEQTEHFQYHRDVEIAQVTEWFTELGITGPLLNAVVKQICSTDEKLLQCMKVFEFPSADTIERNPITAMLMSGRLFFIGSLPSILPFISSNTELALILACVCCGISLFIAGAYKTRTTRGNWFYGGMENLILAGIGAGIAFGIGYAYQVAASSIG